MAITYTMTWAGGLDSTTSGGFVLTDHNSVVHPVSYSAGHIGDIKDFVARAVADELHNQAGSATGTVTVTIA